MNQHVLISCASKKSESAAPARELYQSALFRKAFRYAQQIDPDRIFILSARYGLVSPDDVIEPYNETLNNKSSSEIKVWANRVIEQLKQFADLQSDEFILLAGEKYRRYLEPHMQRCTVPLKGLGIGKQLQKLDSFHKEPSTTTCAIMHELARRLPAFRFPYDPSKIPSNGIYLLFEKGETGHDGDRIVRVGTHTGQNQLRSRLGQHFLNENKDRSIFRKNIGRALLAKNHDEYLTVWDLDMTTKAARLDASDDFDPIKQAELERRITEYIQKSFWFVVVEVPDKADRLRFESRLVSLLSNCGECRPSSSWLGHHSPKEKIRDSGLWQVNELFKESLGIDEVRQMFQN